MSGDRKGEIQWVFCPVVGDRVRVDVVCRECMDWSGVRCNYTDRTMIRMKRIPVLQTKPRKPRSGGGVRVPPVWEKWPKPGYGGEAESVNREDEKTNYGVTELEGKFEEPDSETVEEEDYDYHDPFLLDTHGKPGEPEVEVINDTGEPTATPGIIPETDNVVRDHFSEPFPRLPEDFPETRDPFSELPGQQGPDGKPDLPGSGGNVG